MGHYESFAECPVGSTGTVRLRLLATTDLHMHLCGYNYFADTPDDTSGLSRIATLIRQARAEAHAQNAAVLLLDNGDSLQGTPMADVSVADPSLPHPMMAAFAELAYDAIGLGNHDFDFGLENLGAVLAQAPCPVLCSNLEGALDPVRRTVEVTVPAGHGGDLRVGLLSVLPPQTMKWNAHQLGGRIHFTDMVESAASAAARLRARGCDLVVALAHCGLSDTAPDRGAENAVLPIAALDDIDAVVAGHTHRRLPGPDHAGIAAVDAARGTVHGKPVVMAGSAGSHLGVIDLTLCRRDAGWRVAGTDVHLRPIAVSPRLPEDDAIRRVLAPHHAATRAALARPVAETPGPLHSYFTLFGPDRALALVASAQAAAVEQAARAGGLAGLPLLSAAAPCKAGGHGGPHSYTHVPAGPVTLRNAADLHIYSDEIRLVRITGAQIADWLEMSASLFERLQPGRHNAAMLRADAAGYNFDVIHGLRYAFDLSQPARFAVDGRRIDAAARRVTDLRHDGSPVAPDDAFLVALNSYRLNGGGNFPALAGATVVASPPVTLRDAILDHLKAGGGPDFEPPWRLAPLPGTTADVATSPDARRYLDDIAGLHPEDRGIDPQGFLRLRLSL